MHIRGLTSQLLIYIVFISVLPSAGVSQLTQRERDERQQWLKNIYEDIRNYYYDPKLHGVDLDARFTEAKDKLSIAPSGVDANFQIAAFVETLNDPQTYFLPHREMRDRYGLRYQMIGDRCYLTRVMPGADAEAKGLRPGDEVLTINGFAPTRESTSKMQYAFEVLASREGLQVELRDGAGKARSVEVMPIHRQAWDKTRVRTELEQSMKENEARYEELGKQLMVLKFPSFSLPELKINELIDTARKHGALIIDLRGRLAGGRNKRLEQFDGISEPNISTAETDLKDLLGGMFERDVTIANEITRKKTVQLTARGKRGHAFAGKLIVLVDSESSSVAELFARVVQIEKRGIVLGDQTSGKAMLAEFDSHRAEGGWYGAMVTGADFVMPDGKTLDHIGVIPDEKILPSKEDMVNLRDPVMVRAAEMAGVTLSGEKAYEMFPYIW